MVTIEPPRLKGEDPRQQLLQLQSYLSKTAQQLQWAFETMETREAAAPASGARDPKPAESFSPQAVFGSIKSLIIRSGEILDAYSAQIRQRLEGVYAAKSEFGSFRQETSQTLEADSQSIKQLFTAQQAVTQTVNGLWDQKLETESYIKTGLLAEGEGGKPIYGLEIGQQNLVDGQKVFDRFARFTANRLSFFDSSNVEVAYISDYTLCITNAAISGNLHMGGRYRIYSGRGLIFQWTGGQHNG